jgi:hypothetical protein
MVRSASLGPGEELVALPAAQDEVAAVGVGGREPGGVEAREVDGEALEVGEALGPPGDGEAGVEGLGEGEVGGLALQQARPLLLGAEHLGDGLLGVGVARRSLVRAFAVRVMLPR